MRWLIFPVVLLMLCTTVYADSRITIGASPKDTDYGDIGELAQSRYNISFSGLAEDISYGELTNAEGISDKLEETFLNELKTNNGFIKNILLICILNGVIVAVMEGFCNGEAESVAYFASYTAIAGMLAAGFKSCADMVTGGVDEIFDIIRAGVPLILTLVTAGGGGGEAASFAGILSVVTGAFELMIDKLAVPQIIFAIMLGVLNCMWDRGIVGKLSELFAFLASWEIKICAFLFVGSLTLGRMGAGSASAVVGKGMKLAVGSVPVVGNLFENSLETVAGCITALKGSAAVALIIIIALASAAKLIKLCVVMLLYKLTAALTEPMGNKKITEMLDCAGEGIKLLIAAYFTVIIMFVTAVSVMLGSFG